MGAVPHVADPEQAVRVTATLLISPLNAEGMRARSRTGLYPLHHSCDIYLAGKASGQSVADSCSRPGRIIPSK